MFNLDLSFLYWADVLNEVKFCLILLAIIGGMVFGIATAIIASERERLNGKTLAGLIICLFLIVSGCFIPSKKTIYAIGIANNINNNATELTETITSAIDYITEKVDEVIHGKEETK